MQWTETPEAQFTRARPTFDEVCPRDAIQIVEPKPVPWEVRHRLTGLEGNLHRPARLGAGTRSQRDVHIAAILRPLRQAEPAAEPLQGAAVDWNRKRRHAVPF